MDENGTARDVHAVRVTGSLTRGIGPIVFVVQSIST
jgi:hypothetical protein